MKALTIIQPYAALIASGEKRVENRNWSTTYRGPLAIHAGKAKRYGGSSVTELASGYEVDPGTLAFGAIVAIAELIDCVPIVDGMIIPRRYSDLYPWMRSHQHVEGPVCWVLANVMSLAMPMPCNGAMGLWDWTPAGDLVFAEAAGLSE